MYCKSCGTENPSTANYCVNDGAPLKSIPLKYRGKERNTAFCSSCGAKAPSLANYCQNCGESLIQYSREKTFAPKLTGTFAAPSASGTSSAKLPAFRLEYIKKAILPALLAILVVFVFSFAMMKSSEKAYNDMLNYALKNSDYNLSDLGPEANDLLKAGKFFGISDLLMTCNLQNPDIAFKAGGAVSMISGSVNADALIKNGFLIYLFIPFIGLLAAGILSGRLNQRRSFSERFYDAAGIALLYSIFFTIVSFFAGYSFHTSVDAGIGNFTLDINTNYSAIKTFFMTLLFGFLFSGLGILFSINFKKATGHLEEWLPSGRAINQAIIVPFVGSFVLFIGFFIYLTSKFSEFKEDIGASLLGSAYADMLDKTTGAIATLSVQLASYVWNLLHFAPLTFALDAETIADKGSISYGIFSGLKGTGGAQESVSYMQMALSSTDLEMYLKFGLIIPIALFIWTGFRIAKQPGLIKNLVIFSVVYALIMSGVAAISDIGFNFGGSGVGDIPKMTMSLGFGPMLTFFSSLIFSFVFAYLGSWIPKLKANQ